ncbi:MAG: CsbD family protein [Armatimonadota bacterium]
MNKDELKGKWRQLRGHIKAKWGQLTDDELDQIEGNYDILVGKIQEKYGTTRQQIERELDSVLMSETVHKTS